MLDDHAVFEHGDLGVEGAVVRRFATNLVAHDHHPLDGLSPGQELGLAQDGRTAPAGVAAVPATLPLGLQPGRSADALDFTVALIGLGRPARLPFMHDRVGRIIARHGRRVVVVPRAGLAATATATATGAAVAGAVLVAAVVVGLVGVVTGILIGALAVGLDVIVGVGIGVVTVLLTATSTASPTSTTAAFGGRRPGLFVVGVRAAVVRVVVIIIAGVVGDPHRLRRDEQRKILGALGAVRRGGLEDQPRLGLIAVDSGVGGLDLVGSGAGGHSLAGTVGQRFAHPLGFVVLNGGLGAAGSAVEFDQGIEHSFAGGAQHPRQRMDPQLLGLSFLRALRSLV